MPISGGKYVAPTWNNGSSPAINAAELQAISDTLAAVQTRAKAEVVSYTGTGQSGASHPCSVTFSFVPDVVLFLDVAGSLYEKPYIFTGGGSYYYNYWLRPGLLTSTYQSGSGFTRGSGNIGYMYAQATNGGKTISWYTLDGQPYIQLNTSGCTYYFMAIQGVTTP